MSKIHADRPPTDEPVELAERTIPGPAVAPPVPESVAEPVEQVEKPGRRRVRGPKRPTTSAPAGVASGSGEASGA